MKHVRVLVLAMGTLWGFLGACSSSGSASTPYSPLYCPGEQVVSTQCASCLQTDCPVQIAALASSCDIAAFNCGCPLGGNPETCSLSTPCSMAGQAYEDCVVSSCGSVCNGSSSPPPEPDAGMGAHDSGHERGGGGEDAGADAAPADAAAGDASVCPEVPTLFPAAATALYCHHDSSDVTLSCTLPQTCCLQPTYSAGSACVSAGSACPSAAEIPVACNESANCAPGSICCGTGPLPNNATCGFYQETGLTQTACVAATACPGGAFQICSADTDCASSTCTPFKHVSGYDFGFCN